MIATNDDINTISSASAPLPSAPMEDLNIEALNIESHVEKRKEARELLEIAVNEGNVEELKSLLKANPKLDLTTPDAEGNTPIHWAARQGKIEIIEALLEQNKNILEIRNKEGQTPLHIAARWGQTATVESLIKFGGDLKAKSGQGNTPMHLAAYYGHTETIKVFLRHNPDLANIEGQTKYTPLHSAAQNGHVDTVLELLNNNSNPTAREKNGNTPVHFAAEFGQTEVMNVFLERYPGLVNVKSDNKCSYTPLHWAALKGRSKTLLVLLDKKAHINAKANYGNDPADTAFTVTALHLAAEGGHADAVSTLLERGADAKTQDRYGDTPLHRAARFGKAEVLKVLVKPPSAGLFGSKMMHEANHIVNLKNKAGNTALSLAAQANHEAAVRALLTLGADATIGDATNNTPLHRAAQLGCKETVKILVQHGKSLVHTRSESEMTPLHWAAICGGNDKERKPAPVEDYIEVAKLLLSAGADISAKKSYNELPLHYAAKFAPPQMVSFLIKQAPSLINSPGADGLAPLHCAAKNGNIAAIKALALNDRLDRTAKNKAGDSPLHVTAWVGQMAAVNELLELDHNLIEVKGLDSCTPLHHAAQAGNTEIVRALIEHGANVKAKNSYGSMPIHSAASWGKTGAVKAFIEHDSKFVNIEGAEKYTPLHWAAREGYVETVRFLVSCGANINAKNKNDRIPSKLAQLEKRLEVIRFFNKEYISLQKFASEGDLENICFRLSEGADVAAIDENDNMAIHIAAWTNNIYIVKTLIKHDEKQLNARGGHGYTPLLWAAQQGHVELLEGLLALRADIRAQNNANYAAIHLAVLCGRLEILDILLKRYPSLVNMKGMDEYTPLHCACELKPEIAETSGGLIIEKLLSHGADVNARNIKGQTPLALAVEKGAPFEVIERLNEAQKLQDKPPTYMEAVQISLATGTNRDLRK